MSARAEDNTRIALQWLCPLKGSGSYEATVERVRREGKAAAEQALVQQHAMSADEAREAIAAALRHIERELFGWRLDAGAR